MENDINSKAILDEFIVFKTEHQLDEWMRTKNFLFKEASQILQEGNSTIVYSTKYRYQEKLKHLGITDNDDVECSLTSYIDPDAAKILKKGGIGAGIGAIAAMTFGGPIGWITVIGGALGAGAGRKRELELVRNTLLRNSRQAAQIYADRYESMVYLSKTPGQNHIESVRREQNNILNTASTIAHKTDITKIEASQKPQLNNSNQNLSIKNTSNDHTRNVSVSNKKPPNIRVKHKSFGKGLIESFSKTNTGTYFTVKFANSIHTFAFPGIFIDQALYGILDIEDDLINSQNAINYLTENNLLERFPDIVSSNQKISWMKECVDRYRLLKLFKKFGFIGFLHTSQFNNFKSIYKTNQLLSRKSLLDIGGKFVDCAETEIIEKTDSFVKNSNRFYYRCKTPTNYSALNDHGQSRPVIFSLNENCIYDKSVIFYDGNARANKSSYTSLASQARLFNWDCIFSTLPPYNNEKTDGFLKQQNCTYEDLKRMQNAEFLFKDNIDLSYFDKIYFMTEFDYNEAIRLFGENIKFELKPSIFPVRRYYL